jgi:hypothetical protein
MSSCEVGRAEQFVWHRASFCATGECVEVTEQDGMILLRDSKHPDGGILQYRSEEWQAFVHGIKAGEFDDLG